VINGTMGMKWNKNDCLEKKETKTLFTRLDTKSDCFNTEMMKSKIPCFLESKMNQVFTFEVGMEHECLNTNNRMKKRDVVTESNENGRVVEVFKRQISTEIWNVTTFAGKAVAYGSTNGVGSAARFSGPGTISVDLNGNLYVSDHSNHLIRIITPIGTVTTFAASASIAGSTNGFGSAARFNGPDSITIDSNGNLYVAEYINHLYLLELLPLYLEVLILLDLLME
jgi:hypothetical protein